jgi:cyanosortase A-associated protein
MPEATWKPARLGLLAIVFASTLFMLGRSLTVSAASSGAKKSAVATPQLPQTVPLTGWQATGSTAIALEAPKAGEAPTQAEPDFVQARAYQYRQNGTKLNVEARYMLGDGNNSRFLFVYTPVRAANANLEIRQLPEIGSYGILAHQGKAYLSACVNPSGQSTVTEYEFKQNSYQQDLRVERLWPWLLGQKPLLDQRCLWTLMSVPLAETATAAEAERAVATLEAAWKDWHPWWRANYPSR